MTSREDIIACVKSQGYKGYISPNSIIRARTIYNKDLGEWIVGLRTQKRIVQHIVTDNDMLRWRRSNEIDQIINKD